MMISDEEKELLDYLYQIKDEIVIVEGKHDKEVLKRLHFTKIITLTGKSLSEFEKYREEKVIILTDFDEEGERIAKKLELFLPRRDDIVRKKLRILFKKLNIYTIESLRKIVKRREDDYG